MAGGSTRIKAGQFSSFAYCENISCSDGGRFFYVSRRGKGLPFKVCPPGVMRSVYEEFFIKTEFYAL